MYEDEVKTVEMNYRNWLIKSNISNNELVKRPGEFNLDLKLKGEYGIVRLYYITGSAINHLGDPIVYEYKNQEMKCDVALLLLYISQRLDEINKQEERYFFLKTKKFIKDTELLLEHKKL